jgi:hypothetical protein
MTFLRVYLNVYQILTHYATTWHTMAQLVYSRKICQQGVGDAFRPLFARVWHMLTHGGTGWHTKKKWRPQGDLNPCRRRERTVSDRANMLIYNNL